MNRYLFSSTSGGTRDINFSLSLSYHVSQVLEQRVGRIGSPRFGLIIESPEGPGTMTAEPCVFDYG